MTALASVIIPVRNEAQMIEACLDSVEAQDLGADVIEVIVADGRSDDGTRSLVERRVRQTSFARMAVVENRLGGISAGLNAALGEATAPVTVRIDARSRVEPHYVRTICETLGARPEVGVVGGAQIAVPGGPGVVSIGIARALSNRYATGFSRYRLAASSGLSDTVWMGGFRTAELRSLGGWDESLVANEDYELCERFRAAGLGVWFESTLRSGYVARPDLPSVVAQYRGYGIAKGARWLAGAHVGPRHIILLVAPVAAGLISAASIRRVGAVPVAAASCGAVLLVDHVGGPPGSAGARVRVAAATTSVVTAGAWWTGVVQGYLRGARECPRPGHTGGAG
jgi:succinoglycan biosynthesis protein ExoA